MGRLVPRAGHAERARLHDTFVALCTIESPTGRERGCADWVRRELEELGLEVEEDEAGPMAGSDSGNLLTRISGTGEGWLMLCAHLDTVPLTAPVTPVERDGGWENGGDGILGADNKAAVAVLVELARRLSSAPAGIGVELVFTVAEETGLRGAKAFDVGRLSSPLGFVFDHATPIGEVVMAAPSYNRITAEIHGRAAHAGICPEQGRSAIAAAGRAIAAMKLGRLDRETTANIGVISGGTADNVVPERCHLVGEARALDEQRLAAVTTEMVDALQDGADGAECDLDVTIERMFSGYQHRPSAPGVQLAQRALKAIGHEPVPITTGGGSDANAFEAAGFHCVNLANGTEHNHEPGERVTLEALETGLELAIALVEDAARPAGAA